MSVLVERDRSREQRSLVTPVPNRDVDRPIVRHRHVLVREWAALQVVLGGERVTVDTLVIEGGAGQSAAGFVRSIDPQRCQP